jgi:hypothetical protein
MKAHPAVPAAIVLKHVQGSKNRVTRHAADAENVRRGMRALYEDANALRAALAQKPDEIAVLERGFMALDFVARDLVAGHEQMIQIEQAFQGECLRWLNRKAPGVPVVKQEPAICYVPSKAAEVETPKAILEGQIPAGEPTKAPDASQWAGFYRMEDGTLVFVNHLNEPVPAPKDPQVLRMVQELERAPQHKNEGYVPVASAPPTTAEVPVVPQVTQASMEIPPQVGPVGTNGTGSIGDVPT